MRGWFERIFVPPPAGGEPDVVRAVNETQDTVIAERVEWAGTSETRRRGLLGRDSLGPGEGIYIVPTQWIHMFGMRFAIDVVFLDGEGRVLSLQRNLRPNRLSRPVWRAEGALELPAGAIDVTGIELGDVVGFHEGCGRENVPET